LPISELPSLDLSARFDEYLVRDAAWVPGLPLAINRDFDFALAMSLDGIGAGIAAKKRRDANLELAQRLSGVAPLDHDALLQALCAASPAACERLAGARVRIYGLLFGEHDARLQVVLEVAAAKLEPALYQVVTEAHPVETFLEAGVLLHAFQRATADMASAMFGSASPDTALGGCRVGGTAKVEGRLLESTPSHTVLLLERPTTLRVLCPRDAFEALPPTR
jgi:hypothetical protein